MKVEKPQRIPSIMNMEHTKREMKGLSRQFQISKLKQDQDITKIIQIKEERKLQKQRAQNKPPKAPKRINDSIPQNLSAIFENEKSPEPSSHANHLHTTSNQTLRRDPKYPRNLRSQPNQERMNSTRSKRRTGNHQSESLNPCLPKTIIFQAEIQMSKRQLPERLRRIWWLLNLRMTALLAQMGQVLMRVLRSFRSLLGAEIDSQTDDDMLVNILSENTYISIPKSIFEPFCPKNKAADEQIEPLITNEDNKSTEEVVDQTYDLNFNNLRIADDMTTDIKNYTLSSKNMTASVQEGNNLNDIFGKLELMDGESTLMAGFDDDDDDDTPPPLVPSHNLPVNQRKSEESNMPNIYIEEVKELRDEVKEKPKNPMHQVKTLSFKVLKNRIYDPNFEIQRLREELRLRDAEIHQLNFHVSVMKKESEPGLAHLIEEIDEQRYHLAFLFASPLIRKLNSSIETLLQLEYRKEINNIEKHLRGVEHEIRYKVDVATSSNFRSVVQDVPFAIHFTGHGMRNTKQNLGNLYEGSKNKGDVLLLEDENGIA